MLNWEAIHSGKLMKKAIMEAVKDEEWQRFRKSLKGISTERKFIHLWGWYFYHIPNARARIQVTNYVNALKRGGLI